MQAVTRLVCLASLVSVAGCAPAYGTPTVGTVKVGKDTKTPGVVPCDLDRAGNIRAEIWPNREVKAKKATWIIFNGDPAKKRMLFSDPVTKGCKAGGNCRLIIVTKGKVKKGRKILNACLCLHDTKGRLCPDVITDRACGACIWKR